MTETRISSGLYLELDEAAGAAERLAAAFSVAAPSAVLIRPQSSSREGLRTLVQIVQRQGAAAIIAGDAEQVHSNGADGLHLPWSEDAAEAYSQARALLGRDCIIGVEAGPLRHDAMVLGEAGADYVAFGRDDQVARIEWWAEVFEVPCVALGVGDAAEAVRLAEAGADFIGWRLAAGQAPAAAADGLRTLAAVLAKA